MGAKGGYGSAATFSKMFMSTMSRSNHRSSVVDLLAFEHFARIPERPDKDRNHRVGWTEFRCYRSKFLRLPMASCVPTEPQQLTVGGRRHDRHDTQRRRPGYLRWALSSAPRGAAYCLRPSLGSPLRPATSEPLPASRASCKSLNS